MLYLPVELRRHCLEYLHDDAEALRAARLTNKEFGSLATEILFRTVFLNNTDESADKLTHIIPSSLNSLVRHVVIYTWDDPDYIGGWPEEAVVLKTFGKAISMICDLENLEGVVVNFARDCALESNHPDDPEGLNKQVAQTESFRAELLQLLWAAVRQAGKAGSLTMKNLQDRMDQTVFESEDFKAVRDRLTQLHLQIATEVDDAAPELNIERPACHRGFGFDLPDKWLKPLANQLTHLTLYGTDCLWGVWPFVDLRKLPPFPRLKSLSLGNFTIAHDWQINWILSHGSTLQELLLDHCPIIIALNLRELEAKSNFPDMPPSTNASPGYGQHTTYFREVDLRWHSTLDRFRTGLPQLHHFVMGRGNWEDGTAFEERYELKSQTSESRYIMFDRDIEETQWVSISDPQRWKWRRKVGHMFKAGQDDIWFGFPPCYAEDDRALVTLLEAVKARATGNT